jgi:hypothetical protein
VQWNNGIDAVTRKGQYIGICNSERREIVHSGNWKIARKKWSTAMINEQEMQFADPDWQPSGPLPAPPGNGGASVPVPVSLAEVVNQPSSPSSTGLPSYTQGYQGAWPASQPSPLPPQTRQMPYQPAAIRGRQRGGRWWLWVIIIVLVLSMTGGMGIFSYSGHHAAYQANSPAMAGQSTHYYDLKDATELDINDLSGAVDIKTVNDGGSSIQVISAQGSEPKVFHQGQSMVLTSDDDLTILIPQNIGLKLSGGMSDVEIENFTGLLTAQTNSGSITLNNDNLTQGSSLNTNSGNIDQELGSITGTSITSSTGTITLDRVDLSGQVTISTGGTGTISYTDGALDPRGKYQFTTDSGSITLSLPDGTSMQMKVSQKGGHFNSDFPPGTGSAPQAEVDIITNSGDIMISKS